MLQSANPIEVLLWIIIAIIIFAVIVLIYLATVDAIKKFRNLYSTDIAEDNLEKHLEEIIQRRSKSSLARDIARRTRYSKDISSHIPYFSKRFARIKIQSSQIQISQEPAEKQFLNNLPRPKIEKLQQHTQSSSELKNTI